MPTTRPGEFLVVSRHGQLTNLGEAVHVFLRPGTVWVKVPGVQLETSFEMTQETRDGIPLRFKGMIIYRIVRPEVTAARFDFTVRQGTNVIATLINQCCLGELRDQVSRLTMTECIEQRKTTLTQAVATALQALIGSPENDWGLAVEVAQVAQVFIVDQGLRAQLESGTRSEIQVRSDQDLLAAEESVESARIESLRRMEVLKARAKLDEERARAELEQTRLDLRIAAEAAQLASEEPLVRQRHEQKLKLLREQLEETELELRLSERRVQLDFAAKREEQKLLLERLPIEQRPALAEAASTILQGAKLSVYGEDSRLMGALEPLLEMVGSALRGGVDH